MHATLDLRWGQVNSLTPVFLFAGDYYSIFLAWPGLAKAKMKRYSEHPTATHGVRRQNEFFFREASR